MTSTPRWHALACSLLLLLCILAAWPVAEIGMNDDTSYIRSAQILASTGHIVYNGWATAMLGWQLYLGALFARLFGPSFTSIRASTSLVALATAFLAQRTLVRSGLNARNATFGTLALILSPLFLPLAVSYMTDIGGLFCIILCLYACLRAIQAVSDRETLLWLVFAALSNALGGTVRQIAWLGVLVMVPCTVWLLRRRAYVLPIGVALYTISSAIIFGSLRWFQHMPYSVPEPLIPAHLDRQNVNLLASQVLFSLLDLAMLLVPILAAFTFAVQWRNQRTRILLAAGALACLGAFLYLQHIHRLVAFLAPFRGNYITSEGLIGGMVIQGPRPTLLSTDLRILLTAITLFALLCCITFLCFDRPNAVTAKSENKLPGIDLLVLVGPFTLAYLTLLIPRGLVSGLFDRYLLPLMFVGVLLLLRTFQDRVQPQLPRTSIALILLLGLFAVAGTHDAFSMYRGRVAAIDELHAAGVPDNQVDAGFEHNSLAQFDQVGYLNEPRIRVPAVVYVESESRFPPTCSPQLWSLSPVIQPGYTLSFDPSACGGPSRFAPVVYHQWLGEHTVNIYIVNTLKAEHHDRQP